MSTLGVGEAVSLLQMGDQLSATKKSDCNPVIHLRSSVQDERGILSDDHHVLGQSWRGLTNTLFNADTTGWTGIAFLLGEIGRAHV